MTVKLKLVTPKVLNERLRRLCGLEAEQARMIVESINNILDLESKNPIERFMFELGIEKILQEVRIEGKALREFDLGSDNLPKLLEDLSGKVQNDKARWF